MHKLYHPYLYYTKMCMHCLVCVYVSYLNFSTITKISARYLGFVYQILSTHTSPPPFYKLYLPFLKPPPSSETLCLRDQLNSLGQALLSGN